MRFVGGRNCVPPMQRIDTSRCTFQHCCSHEGRSTAYWTKAMYNGAAYIQCGFTFADPPVLWIAARDFQGCGWREG